MSTIGRFTYELHLQINSITWLAYEENNPKELVESDYRRKSWTTHYRYGEPDQCDTIQTLTFNAVMRFHEYNT